MRKYNLTEAFEELDKIYNVPVQKKFLVYMEEPEHVEEIITAKNETDAELEFFERHPDCYDYMRDNELRYGRGACRAEVEELDDAGNPITEAFDEEEIEIVDKPIEEPEVSEPSCVEKTANEVMAAYQNANKWLDSVKEAIYTKMSCPVLSNYIHQLAHKMPQEFDDFGSILHTVNMEIPYPATAEISKKPETIVEAIEMTLSFLDDIKVALNAFITCTDNEYHGMSCAAESCLNKIEEEYPMLYRLLDNAKKYIDDTVSFDKYVLALVEHKDELLD